MVIEGQKREYISVQDSILFHSGVGEPRQIILTDTGAMFAK